MELSFFHYTIERLKKMTHFFTNSNLNELLHFAFHDFPSLNKEKFIEEVSLQITPSLTEKEILQLMIRTAVEKTTMEETEWEWVSSRILLQALYAQYSTSSPYGNFFNHVSSLVQKGLYGDYLLEAYTKDAIDELGSYINPERDLLFRYSGLSLLTKRYLVRDFEGKLRELPQHRFMTIAMHLASKEKDNVYWAKQFYDVLSKLEITVATPTLAHAGRPFHQLSSCFIDTAEDSLWNIYHTDQSFAQVSKYGGGMGIYVGKLRARGSSIRGFKGVSAGIIPWIRNYNNTAVAVDQLGMRKGAVAIYCDIWHYDILEFLQLKTNNGDDRLKAHDIFPGVCIPDIFMEKVIQRENWYLFDPYEVEQEMGFRLEDCYDDDEEKIFTKRYLACVENEQLRKKEIPAIDIMKMIMKSAFETGTPFIFYRDTVNRLNPNKHEGMIYCSNLCTEIMQNMRATEFISETLKDDVIMTKTKPGDFVVCNLSSINLGKIETEEDLKRILEVEIRMLDNVIDLNDYPVPQAKVTNQKYRAIGVGTSGYHHHLAKKKIAWESEEHLTYADQLYEKIAYYSIQASNKLAREKGAYPLFNGSDWENGNYFTKRKYDDEKWTTLQEQVKKSGLRNAYVMAVAPTSSTSLIAGTTASIDPLFAKFFVEEKKDGLIPQAAPDLTPETTWYYKEAHSIDQFWSIKAAGRRQKHLDQAQSFNLYITPTISARDFLQYYIEAWKNGLKTIYYVRNRTVEIDECISCSS